MFGLADNDTTILHNVLGLDKNIATVHMLDFSLLVLMGGGTIMNIHKIIKIFACLVWRLDVYLRTRYI